MKRRRFYKRLAAIWTTGVWIVCMSAPRMVVASETADDVYTLRFVPARTSISSEEIEAGDVVISAKVYLTGSTENSFGAIQLRYQSDSSNVYFQDMIVGDNTSYQDEATTYESSQGTFTTNYMPYCFGYLSGSRYITGSSVIVTNANCCDPITGKTLYCTGTGQVMFTTSYYQGVDTDGDGVYEQDTETGMITETITCDVTEQADGSGTYTFSYIDQSTYETKTAVGEIPRYDSIFQEEGTVVPGECSSIVWTPYSQIESGASFYWETTDEFPFLYVDIVVKQGTPEGSYAITFDTSASEDGTIYCKLVDAANGSYGIETEGAVLVVGEAETTSAAADTNISASESTSVSTSTAASTSATTSTSVSTIRTSTSVSASTDATTSTSTSATTNTSTSDRTESDVDTASADSQTYMLGDVNQDSAVDMQDAYLVLTEYAAAAVGEAASFDFIQRCAADIDSDGAITLQDAFYILSYYANCAVNHDVSWKELLT